MKGYVLVLVAAAGELLAQSGIAPPRVGYIRDDAGGLRPVYGVAGSFVLGRPINERPVISAAFSGRLGLAKTAAALYAFSPEGRRLGRLAAMDGPAQFAFSPDGSEAIVYMPSTSEWFRWRSGGFQPVPVEDLGELVRPTGLALAGGKSLVVEDNELVLRKPDGTETRAVLTGPILSIEWMGNDWIYVREAGRHTVVRLVETRLYVYRLPEAAPW
jgi:hypothetical protein